MNMFDLTAQCLAVVAFGMLGIAIVLDAVRLYKRGRQ